eukprot:356805-Rhodomonas_salina.3
MSPLTLPGADGSHRTQLTRAVWALRAVIAGPGGASATITADSEPYATRPVPGSASRQPGMRLHPADRNDRRNE